MPESPGGLGGEQGGIYETRCRGHCRWGSGSPRSLACKLKLVLTNVLVSHFLLSLLGPFLEILLPKLQDRLSPVGKGHRLSSSSYDDSLVASHWS